MSKKNDENDKSDRQFELLLIWLIPLLGITFILQVPLSYIFSIIFKG